ncbi:MAG: nucleoside recognition domain-containing protein [Candidatus Gastranaerophilales bacterium]|nr:nucleoside recognition domain-containing protein [Candidatus Gastranaerophilales bacterium]
MLKEILNFISVWTLPLLVASILLCGVYAKIPLYETFIKGAKQGIGVGVKIIPFLVAILVAIGMFRASGAIDLIAQFLAPVLDKIGMPADVLPLAIIRPLSGSGALGIMSEIAGEYGGNAFVSKLAAVMVGSTETTFYVLTVYFGSVGVIKFRHALIAGLIADVAGLMTALFVSQAMFL